MSEVVKLAFLPTDRMLEVPTGMTRKMFRPLSLALFGTHDYVAEVEQWLLSKLVNKTDWLLSKIKKGLGVG